MYGQATQISHQIWSANSSTFKWYSYLVYEYQQDFDTNKTKVTFKCFKFVKKSQYGDYILGTVSYGVKYGTKQEYHENVSYSNNGDSAKELPLNLTFEVESDLEGKTSITIKYKEKHVEDSVFCPKIDWTDLTISFPDMDPPFSRPVVSDTDIKFGDEITINLTGKANGQTHKLYYQTENIAKTLIATLDANTFTYKWVVPHYIAVQENNSLSVPITLICESYSGNTIVATRNGSFVAKASEQDTNFVPVISNVSPEIVTQKISNVIIKGYSYVNFNFDVETKLGSTLTNLYILMDGVTYNGRILSSSGSTYHCYIPINKLVDDSSTSIERNIYVVDSRGMYTTYKWTGTMYEYTNATITKFTAYRCLENGTVDDVNGDYVKFNFGISITSINGLNKAIAKLQVLIGETWTDIENASWTSTNLTDVTFVSGTYSLDETYKFRLLFCDTVNEDNVYAVLREVIISYSLINFGANGKSIALGMKSSNNGEFESAIPYVGKLGVKKSGITTVEDDTVEKWSEVGTGFFYYSNTESIIEKPSDYGFLVNIVRGKYIRQLWLILSKGSIYHRGGNENGWNGNGSTSVIWRRLLDNTNVINNLTSTSTVNPLSANQGKVLKDLIDELANTPKEWVKIAETTTTGKEFTVADFETTYSEILIVCRGTAGHVLSTTTIPMSIYKSTTTTSSYFHRTDFSSVYYGGIHRVSANKFIVYHSGTKTEIYAK